MNDVDGAAGGHRGTGQGRIKSEAARDYGVSRRWVFTLVQRFLAEGEPGLAPRSRRPHSSPARTALGAQAGEARLTEILRDAGFTRVRRAAETPFNLIIEARP